MSVLSMTPSPSLATSILGGGKTSFFNNILLIIAGSVLIALTAQIAIPVAGSPVPATGQTFGVLLVGMALGSRRGALAVIAYLAEGAMGAPVFALGASAPALVGPTAGYLYGFVPAAFLVGYLAENGWDRNPVSTALAMLAGNIILYIPGLVYLSMVVGTTPTQTLAIGFLPYYGIDVAKLILAAAAMPIAWKFLGKKIID